MLKHTWKSDKGLVLAVCIQSPAVVLLPLLSTILLKYIVDLVARQTDIGTFLISILGIAGLMLLANLLNDYAGSRIEWHSAGNRFYFLGLACDKDMDADYCNIESPDGQTRQQKALNGLMGNSGVDHVFNQMVAIGSNLFGLVTYSALIWSLSPWIVVFLLAFSLIGYFVQRVSNNWNHAHKDNWVPLDRKLNYITRTAGDYKLGKDLRIYHMDRWLSRLFESILSVRKKWYKKVEGMHFLNGSLSMLLTLIRDGGAYIFLIHRILGGAMSAGSFAMYFGLITQYSNWLVGLMDALNNLYNTSLSLCDLRDFLDMPDRSNRASGRPLPEETCEIRFEHVSFTYTDEAHAVIRDLNLTIRKGEKIALVGLNGAGKTTLIKLLCGLYQPSAGCIKVNGVPIGEYNRDAYYRIFSVVFQDMVFLPVSIAANIALCKEADIDRAKLQKVLALSGLKTKVDKLPEHEQTLLAKSLNEKAIELSGGEQQKLALARAIYKDGSIILLDEPTAALDPIAENEIYQKYNDLTAGKTAIFISHRLASTRFCERILYFEQGKIMEEGSHEELLKRQGKYAALYRIQSKYYREGGGKDEVQKGTRIKHQVG